MITQQIEWEYFLEYENFHSNNTEEIKYLDMRGLEGWELVSVIEAKERTLCRYYFKRPIIQSPDKQEP